MKRISIEELTKACEGNPQLWHHALQSGKVIGGFYLELPDDYPLDIAPKPIETHPYGITDPTPMNRSVSDIKRIEGICSECDWNQDWICQHLGCLPCRQRASGGLKGMIAQAASVCPAGKW